MNTETLLATQDSTEIATAWDGVELTKTGMIFKRDISFEEWQGIGERLQFIEKAVQFWVGDWIRYGEVRYGEMYAQAVEDTPYEYGTLANMAYVSDHIDFSRRRENLSFTHHAEVASLEPADQEFFLGRAEEEALSTRELRQAVKEYKNSQNVIDTPELPTGKYSVILADPPWRYDYSLSDSRQIENQYPTMELDEICSLPVGEILEEDCILFLWATSPKLTEALKVMESWGFGYRTCMVWDKEVIGMGYYARQQHELLLIGTRGTPGTPLPENRPPSVIRSKRAGHSEKPEEFHALIEAMYPHLSKVELFCRKPRDGWQAWGNEL